MARRTTRRLAGAIAVALVMVTGPTTPGPASGQPGAGAEIVRIPFPQDDGNLTPYTFDLAYPLVTLVYDTLLWRDVEGVPRSWLAESVDTAPDGRQLTVRLAEGVRWHDGVPLTSADVAFTFRYVSENFHPRFTPELRAVEGVVAPDPTTVVITLRQPSPGFADQPLADLPIMPAHVWQSLAPGQAAPDGLPVGSGPYRLVEHRPGERYRLEANSDYFRGRPAVDAIEVPIMSDAEEMLAALERRQVDMLPINLGDDLAARLEALGTAVARGPWYGGTVLVFNLVRPPFDRVEARRAVADALDLSQIARSVGGATPAEYGYLHPDSPWANREVLHRFNREAAREELTRLELAPLTVLAPESDPVKVEAGRQVALALRRAGIEAESQALPRDDFSRALGRDGSIPQFTAAIVSSPPLASYDPDFLSRVFGTNPRLAPLNDAGFRDAEFDRLSAQVSSTDDADARRVLVGDQLRLVSRASPVVPLFFTDGAFAYRPAVYDGWVFVKGTGILDKRSFVEPRPGRPDRPPASSSRDGGSLPLLGFVGGALLVLAVAAGGWALVHGRR